MEIRDPIYGFIEITEWEKDIINNPIFQRLRRIRQLSGTEMVYPGASHNRFEHSLGVMHVATQFYDTIVSKHRDLLKNELDFDDIGIERDRVLLRIACLLHDIGHSPFSHSGEELMPLKTGATEKYEHEDYSEAAVRILFNDVINNHPKNQNYRLSSNEIADFIQGKQGCGRSLFWREILSGNLDADRSDYLLRDAHHTGVGYGKFDLQRLRYTLTIAYDPEIDQYKIAIEDGGIHAAEGLIIARYMMFTQVYFHKTRRAYDNHILRILKKLLKESSGYENDDGHFPCPTSEEKLREYFSWDDWKVHGLIQNGKGGFDGDALTSRNHDRCVWETPESPTYEDLQEFERKLDELKDFVSFTDSASNSWYKINDDLNIVPDNPQKSQIIVPLSKISSVVQGLKMVDQHRIYVPLEKKADAIKAINGGEHA